MKYLIDSSILKGETNFLREFDDNPPFEIEVGKHSIAVVTEQHKNTVLNILYNSEHIVFCHESISKQIEDWLAIYNDSFENMEHSFCKMQTRHIDSWLLVEAIEMYTDNDGVIHVLMDYKIIKNSNYNLNIAIRAHTLNKILENL